MLTLDARQDVQGCHRTRKSQKNTIGAQKINKVQALKVYILGYLYLYLRCGENH